MNKLVSRCGPFVAPVYGALTYVASLVLLFGAAVLTSTHARVAFIFVFIPAVLLAVLSVFIWTGSRSAMILAVLVAAVLELIMVGNAREDWAPFLPLLLVFALLTACAFAAPAQRANDGGEPHVVDEVYAAVVYFAALLAAFMAPFNYGRNVGVPTSSLYALLVGVVLGALSVLIWRGKVWAMVAVFVLSLAHWIVLAVLDPTLWQNVAHIAAPVVTGILTGVRVALDRSRFRKDHDPR
jgi:hypothetical protein